ncbi:hypothetical protein [Enterovibrio norvegicus]|uniref:hypothetical protein n=1 Tax=Enterovibrio norvegicus TaxID=188144 RepID=UPI000C84BDF3|nr:hypothetical protein [Enterovibrio norvegicus]PMI30881.1 hypothetical protein BCU47_16735 [Enterovibrio norvegicus]
MRRQLIDWFRYMHPDTPVHLENQPLHFDSIDALNMLDTDILGPIELQHGSVSITYAFTSNTLKNHLLRHSPGQMAPALDQHAASELNANGKLICKRQGAACDFLVMGFEKRMDIIAQFIITQLPFDRLYFYGKDRPIHVSIGPDNSRFVQIMKPSNQRHAVPTKRATGIDSLRLFE